MHITSNRIVSTKVRNGYTLIILLVVVVIGVILFFLQRGGFLEGEHGNPNAKGITPWKEWMICEKIKAQAKDDAENEKVNVGFVEYKSHVYLEGTNDSRGDIRIVFSSDGISGNWSGIFHGTNRNLYDIMNGEFSGQFYPDRVFRDEQANIDTSKKYFLCKGEFLLLETGKSKIKYPFGDLYIRGWFGKDKIVEGKFFITSDEKNSWVFTFRGRVGI